MKSRTSETGTDYPASLFSFIWRRTSREQIFLVAMAIVIVPLTVVPLELQKRIVDDGILGKDIVLLVRLLLAYAIVSGSHVFLLYAFNMRRGTVHETVARRLRQGVVRVLPAVAAKTDQAAGPGTLVSVLTAESEPVGQFSGEAFSLPLVNGGILAGVLGYMFFTEVLLAGVVVVLLLPQILLIPWLQSKMNRRIERRIELLRDAGENSINLANGEAETRSLEVLGSIREVYRLRRQIYRLKYIMKYTVLGLHYASILIVLGLGGYLCQRGEIGVGVLVAFLSGLERMRSRWKEMVGYFRRKESASVKYELIRQAI